MDEEPIVVSEINLTAAIVLLCFPVALLAGAIIGQWDFQDTLRYRRLGDFIYVFFYGGLAYAIYEFSTAIRKRRTYMSVRNGVLEVFAHMKIPVTDIRKIYIAPGYLISNIVVVDKAGNRRKVRTYLLKDDPETVLERLAALTPLKFKQGDGADD